MTIYRFSLEFLGSSTLESEAQAYLRHKAKRFVVSDKPVAIYLYDKWKALKTALRIIYEELNMSIESILDLTFMDVQELQVYLAQESNFSFVTQRTSLVELKAFHRFIASTKDEQISSPFKNLRIPNYSARNAAHITPISEATIKILLDNLEALPRYIQLAFFIGVFTAARANSICLLTTDTLQKTNKGYSIQIYYQKTAGYRIRQGKSPYTIHKIPEWLANNLLEYIHETENLRIQLDTPYIFVYRRRRYRNDTLRKPLVLQADTFSNELQELVDLFQQYDENGKPLKSNFRNIRAAVGRAMFAAGATEKEVADKLGNTPIVSRTHYDTMYPAEEAELYNRQYEATIETVKDLIEPNSPVGSNKRQAPNKELYGFCNSFNVCGNENDCKLCSQRIIYKDLSRIGENIS